MKKSKRLRFYALIQKQSQGALTAAEQLELNELSKLASQHPNAATDEDDTAEGEGDDKKKDGEEEGAGDGEKSEGEDDKDKDKAKSKKTKTSLSSMIGAAIASAKAGTSTATSLAEANKTISTLNGDLAKARADLATAQASLTTANASLATATGQLASVLGFLGLEVAAFAGKSTEQVAELVGTAVNSAVTEQLGTLGFPAASLPASTSTDKADTKADLFRQFNAITDPNKRAEFYDKHQSVLMS